MVPPLLQLVLIWGFLIADVDIFSGVSEDNPFTDSECSYPVPCGVETEKPQDSQLCAASFWGLDCDVLEDNTVPY